MSATVHSLGGRETYQISIRAIIDTNSRLEYSISTRTYVSYTFDSRLAQPKTRGSWSAEGDETSLIALFNAHRELLCTRLNPGADTGRSQHGIKEWYPLFISNPTLLHLNIGTQAFARCS